MKRFVYILTLCLPIAQGMNLAVGAERSPADQPQITLRAHGVMNYEGYSLYLKGVRKIHKDFQRHYPHIRLVPATGLTIPGGSGDITPLIQIAGDIPPEVMHVDFRRSDTYVRNKFLYPLDKYIERFVGREISGGHLMNLDEYLDRLRRLPGFEK